jgi:hypothetical protein
MISGARGGMLRATCTGLAIAALMAVGFVAGAPPVVAGDRGAVFNVTKTVIGAAPSGTAFHVDWSCNNATGGTLSFGATGGTQSFDDNGPGASSCAINESGTGGAANVAYHCQASDPSVTCGPDGKSATFTGVPDPAGTFTVTDTYSNAFSPPTPNPNPATAGQSVTLSGTGCTKAVFGGSPSTGGNVQVTVGFTPPVMLGPFSAQGGTGNWTVNFTVPPGTPPGSYSINAVCNDPVPYPIATLVIGTAAPSAVLANPAFTG